MRKMYYIYNHDEEEHKFVCENCVGDPDEEILNSNIGDAKCDECGWDNETEIEAWVCDECGMEFSKPGKCTSCGGELNYYRCKRFEYEEARHMRESYEASQRKAMEDCDGSWDY